MWFEDTRWWVLWLLKFPCVSHRHTQADFSVHQEQGGGVFKVEAEKLRRGYVTCQGRGPKQVNSLRSNREENFKPARAQCDEDLANMRAAQRNLWAEKGYSWQRRKSWQKKNVQGYIPPPPDLWICSVAESGGATPLLSLLTDETVNLPSRQHRHYLVVM